MPKSSKDKKAKKSVQDKDDKTEMKDERERRHSGRKDKDTKIAVQAVSVAKESVDTTSLHTLEGAGQISLDIGQFNALMNFVQ